MQVISGDFARLYSDAAPLQQHFSCTISLRNVCVMFLLQTEELQLGAGHSLLPLITNGKSGGNKTASALKEGGERGETKAAGTLSPVYLYSFFFPNWKVYFFLRVCVFLIQSLYNLSDLPESL